MFFYFENESYSQDNSSNNFQLNTTSKMLISDKKLNIGGYGQIDYNQPFGGGTLQNGKLDVHRLILFVGYRFTNKLSFVSEIEIEHASEIYIEQAFVNYAFNTYLNVRGGMLLIPVGVINLYHEPPTFNGVERPLIDKYIVPTTWRELGAGIAGSIPDASLKYQFYVVGGFKSYDNGTAGLTGETGLRKGRQKGIEAIITYPNFTARLDYYGILGLNLGLSAYFGKTQSTLFNGLDRNDPVAVQRADSSVVGISLAGFDLRYTRKGFHLRGQLYYSRIKNTEQYNYFTSEDNEPNDLGSSMYGYYIEVSYNVFYPFEKIKNKLVPFVRYSSYDTQATTAGDLPVNDAYQVNVITTGIGFWFIPQVAIKTDVQFLKNKIQSRYNYMFNAGIALMF